jgi:hypothetical protein
MIDEQKLNRIKELTRRAASINAKLLKEEKRFIDALAHNSDTAFLSASSNKLHLLLRKEVLYIQAAQNLLRQTLVF